MHIQSLLVPAILAIGASAGASRWCKQWSNKDNQAMKCYWETCDKNDYYIGYQGAGGRKILSSTKNLPASAQCNPQSDVYHKYSNLPSEDCCDAFGNQYLTGCFSGWSDLWCERTK